MNHPDSTETSAPVGALPLPEKFKDRVALRVTEAARLLGCSGACLRWAIAKGELHARRIGKGEESAHYIIPILELGRWLSNGGEK